MEEFAEVKKVEKKVYKNIWMISTIVLAVVVIVLLLMINSNGASINANVVGQKVVDFAKSQGANATLVSVGEENGLFKVTLSINSQQFPVYVTKDGQNLVPSLIPMTATNSSSSNSNNQQQTTPAPIISKSNKPTVNFFVFAYCPFGTQIEKALVPAYNLLKNEADINIVFIGAMHGEFEHQESLRQLCIQKNYGKDKLFSYLDKFLVNANIGNCQGVDSCVNPLIESIYAQIGVDKTKINSCMTTDAETLYQKDEQLAKSLGIGGSPSVTINGVELGGNSCGSSSDCNPGESCVVVDQQGNMKCMLSRNADSVKTSICNAFTTAPNECSQQLSTASTSSGFGSSSGSGSAASCG